MSATIYHFSATGNSLAIARELAEGLDDTELVPLANATAEQLTPSKDVVGIVFPVYAWGPPAVVARFLDKLTIGSDTYVFAVSTCGGSAGGTLGKVRQQLQARGIALSSGFVVTMPSNYIVWGGAFSEEKQQNIIDRARARVDEICTVVKQREVKDVDTGTWPGRLLTRLLYPVSIKAFARMDKKFSIDETCNGCGLCERLCQVGNIRITDDRPEWLHHCEQCLACIQWCPQEAIQIGKKTKTRKRYHHPDIKAKDLIQ